MAYHIEGGHDAPIEDVHGDVFDRSAVESAHRAKGHTEGSPAAN
jgi:hypothetical protein